MKSSTAANAVGLVVAGASGGILVEEILDAGSPDLLLPAIGFVIAVAALILGASLRQKER